MGYYDEYLEHGDRTWKKHKYITREKKNGKWRYIYHDKSIKDTAKAHYVEGKTPEEAMRNAYNAHKAEYDKFMSPDYKNADGSDGKEFAKWELEKMGRIAKDRRQLQEESPKAKLGKALLKIKNAETVLKTKIKDLFTVTTETTISTKINDNPAQVTKKTTKKSLLG